MSFKAEEEVTITYKGLKDAQNEAFQDGIRFAKSQIVYYLAGDVTRDKIFSFLTLLENSKLYEVQEDEGCDKSNRCDDAYCNGCEIPEDHCCCSECKDLS